MINYRINLDTDDTDMVMETLSISFPVRLAVGDIINLSGIEKTDLSDDFILSLMSLVNSSSKAMNYAGKIESKEDAIEFLEYAAWEVTNVIISPKELCVNVELI